MSRKRRNHSLEFKSKVALAVLKGDQALSELSQRYGINSHVIMEKSKVYSQGLYSYWIGSCDKFTKLVNIKSLRIMSLIGC